MDFFFWPRLKAHNSNFSSNNKSQPRKKKQFEMDKAIFPSAKDEKKPYIAGGPSVCNCVTLQK